MCGGEGVAGRGLGWRGAGAGAWGGHLMVAHGRGPDDGARVSIVEDAHAPHTLTQLVYVLPRAEDEARPSREEELVVFEAEHFRLAHRVAVVVGVLSLGHALCAAAPRT